MGLNGSHTYAVSIENVTVPVENLLGREGQGLHQTLEALNGGRIAIGALSVGLAQAAYEAAVAYAKERKTFTASRLPSTRPSRRRSPTWLPAR